MMVRLAALCGALAFAAGVARAHAAAPDDAVARAKDSFKAGAAAYAAGEYVAAIQALDAAYDLLPLPAIGFSLAQAERKQYFASHEVPHLERAIRLFREYLERVPSGGRRADALDALAQLEPIAATLTHTPRTESSERRVQATRLMITSEAHGARVVLDGASAAPAPLVREVTPGKHHLVVSAPGYFPSERDVIAVNGELMLKEVPLRERPSRLGIWSPPDAEIYVDGAFVSSGGSGVTLSMPAGRHRLAIAAKGFGVDYRDVNLTRGETSSLRATLEPTSQRTAALGLFIGGGAALGTSLVLSALTIQAEGRAEAFLARRARGNVTEPERVRYEGAVATRDQYRIGMDVSLAAAGAMFVTGLFLWELDRPDPERVRRSVTPAPGKPSIPARQSVRVQLFPDIRPGGLGAVLHVSM